MARLAGIASVFPDEVRANQYYEQLFPESVRAITEKSLTRIWSPNVGPIGSFLKAMQPYADDPFRGSRERRCCSPDETSLDLEERAFWALLKATGLRVSDVGLLISVSLWPQELGAGNAVFLAKRLGLAANAWNLESGCAGGAQALEVASGLVDAGGYRNVVITVGCDYTRHVSNEESWTWFLGDGGGAFLVSADCGAELVGWNSIHTAATVGALNMVVTGEGTDCSVMRLDPGAEMGASLNATAEDHLVAVVGGLCESNGLARSDVDTWVPNTPTAWFHSFVSLALGIPIDRVFTTHSRYANCGPALLPANLHAAADSALLKDGKLVVTYSPGATSSATAMLLRWSRDVVLA